MYKNSQFSVIPAVRCTKGIRPEIRAYSVEADMVSVKIIKNDKIAKKYFYPISKGQTINIKPDLSMVCGDITIRIEFLLEQETVFAKDYPYQVVDTSLCSTTLIDGCWVGLCHWSEDEGKWFNAALKTMKDDDFKDHIRAMHKVGINGVVIQNIFDCGEYSNSSRDTSLRYNGKAFYPSEIFPERMPLASYDPIEAILSAADECSMHVFVGIGLYAWFDFCKDSLEWHKKVIDEVYAKYAHHRSFYGWYISEEMFGALYYDYEPTKNEAYKDIATFFKEIREYTAKLTPTKPVALAPNNIRFHEFEKEWQEILPYIDILIPFAFARDLEHLNVLDIRRICEECNTHMWVDMEIFENPFPDGLKPKNCEDLIREIRIYDDVEQIYGYQFTGLLNPPESKFDLGGDRAKELYVEYEKYYNNFMTEQNNKQ